MLWSPILPRDNQRSAVEASAYLNDPRVEHFWDLWGFGMKTFTSQLRYPRGELAWDLFILYRPRLTWGPKPPDPTVWMQNRGLSHGLNYTQDLLEKELIRLSGQ